MRCFLNGKFLPLAQARISPFDRGFLFGDGVYEVIPVYRGHLFHWQRHLQRLSASLEKIHLPFAVDTLLASARQLIQDDAPQLLYIQITRGELPERRAALPDKIQPTVFIAIWEYSPPNEKKIKEGVFCHTATDIRWAYCNIKSTSLLGSVLLAPKQQARAEEVMLFRDGYLTEGSSSNFIVIKDGMLHLPIADNRILLGVTYRVVCEVAAAIGMRSQSGNLTEADVAAADEIWLTSSARELLPVVRINETPVGNGTPGAVFRKVYAAWRDYLAGDAWYRADE